nr:MAG: hypothetical protein [Bacteriophage sp.]
MADLLAQGYITIAVVNDGYSLSLTTSSVSIPANHDGSDPDLSCAYTNVSLSKGNVSQPIEIINVIPSTNGIQYTYVPAGPYNWKVSIIGLASDITSGYLDIIVRTPDGYQTSARFNFSVVRNTTSLDWIEEWNGTHTQIGSNYVITPKLFAGHKTSEGKITGIYLGKLKGFIGEVFPFTLSDAEEGLYGYRDNKIVFYIDNNGARIGGWDITPDSIQCLDGTLTIKSEGAISSQSDGIEHWALKKDGSASFANGKVTMDAKGNASFDGHIIARSGELAGWTIGEQSIYKVGVAINSSRRFIAAANVITSELEGDQFDWVKQYGGAAMYYISNADYGFIGYKGDKLMFSAGSKNYIAGWSFDESAFWLGTKNNNMGQFTKDASSITIGTNGIRGYKFYLDKNGAGALAGGNIVWDETGKVTFSKDVTLQWSVGIENAQELAKQATEAAKEAQEAAKVAGDKYGQLIGTYLTYIDQNGIYTGTLAADQIISGTISTANIKQVNNRWFLNQDGSGALANGNISWDQDGNVQFSNDVILAWKDVLEVGSYTVSMTTPSVVCTTDNDGNNPDLSNAYTTISVWSGKTPAKFTILNVFPSADGIKYSYENAGDYSWRVALTNVAANVQSGFLTIVIKTQDNFEMSVRFSFAMVRNPKELAFLDEWEGSYTQIGSNYVVTPRIFAGMKTSAGKLTGVYLGKLSGYLGQTLPFTLSEAEAGIYGYKDSTIIFSIDNQGALIAGWKFDSESLYLGNKNNTSGQFTNASGSITIGTKGIRGFKWGLNSDGSGSLAGGNIKWDAAGNVTFGASVILNWTNAAQEAADAAKDEAIDEAQEAAEAAEAAAKELASAMAFGKMLYRDPTFVEGDNGISVYNNSGNGTVTITRTSSSTVPNDSGKMLTIKNTGTASPYCGGFSFTTQCGYRKIFITRIIAKIPVGRDITFHTNSMGTGGTQKWLTPTKGTGDWQEYICKVYCGTSNFSSTHFFAITGAYNVTWYLAYATVFDVTTSERYTTTIDANGIYTATLNANQITAGTIDADRIGAKSITADKIAANTITSAQINGDSIKANIINTDYINGLSCTFTKGKIGGWTIGANSITKNSVSLGSDGTISNGSYWSLKNDGSGFFAKGNITWKTDGTFEAKNGKFTGEIQTTKGKIGGFEIASGRIGVATSSGATSGNSGLSILQDFIKFSNSYCWASIGVNVLPSSTGIVGVGRFTNSTPNSYGTNYGLLINVSGAQQNIGIVSNGAVVCNSYITDYGISKLTPSANTCFVVGDKTKPNLFKLLVSFVNDNAGVGLPTRTSVCSVLGISSSTAFAVRITIICDRSSSKTGYVCGRNTFVGNGTMNSNYYPYMLNQNADNQTGKWNMARGDTREFMLVWDGSSNYYAYLLNISE